MAHILTSDEAMGALRISSTDECPNLDMLLSAADDGIKAETGFDWAVITETYTAIDPTAKIAAMLLIISLNEGTDLPQTYGYKIGQLHAKALEMTQDVTTDSV